MRAVEKTLTRRITASIEEFTTKTKRDRAATKSRNSDIEQKDVGQKDKKAFHPIHSSVFFVSFVSSW